MKRSVQHLIVMHVIVRIGVLYMVLNAATNVCMMNVLDGDLKYDT